MDKIYKALEKCVMDVYKTDLISLNLYFHHALNYPEVTTLLGNYKLDINKFKDSLNKYVISEQKTSEQLNNEDLLDPFYNFNSNVKIKRRIYQTKEMIKLIEVTMNIEFEKQMKNPSTIPMNGKIFIDSQKTPFESVLRALFLIESESATKMKQLLQDNGFKVDRFLRDFERGENESLIEKYAENLNLKAEDGLLAPVIGRENEVKRMINILKKAKKNNVVLNGPAGVGKTAIVESFALDVVNGNVPESLKNATVYELSIANLTSGTKFRGEFEKRVEGILREFKEMEEDGEVPILFIDELHTAMGAGSTGEGNLDFSNMIKPALSRGKLRMIGATTTDEWYKFIKKDKAFDRRFEPITVKEPSKEETKKIIENSISFYEESHNVKYNKKVISTAVELADQFIADKFFPDKALDLIDYVGSFCHTKNKREVSVSDLEKSLAEQKNIDLDYIVDSRKDNVKPLLPRLKEVVFGQDEALETVSKSIEKVLAGLNDKDKPYGAFLFTGKTGTGKTELAKQLAKEIKANFHRLDMSEFKEAHSISKLIGSPAGYVGYQEGSSLTKVINEHPRTVLLLDEIEKAHPDIYNLFLQVMDYGKLTDSQGQEINFRNVVIIMTSNAGVSKVSKIGLNGKDSGLNKTIIQNIFSPEFRARLTGNKPVQFNDLDEKMLSLILDKFLNLIQKERLDDKKIKIKLSDKLKSHIISIGLKEDLGARPIKEFIENNIIEKLTSEILFGSLKNLKKIKTITFDYIDNNISYYKD